MSCITIDMKIAVLIELKLCVDTVGVVTGASSHLFDVKLNVYFSPLILFLNDAKMWVIITLSLIISLW